jgi:hypothetical protein
MGHKQRRSIARVFAFWGSELVGCGVRLGSCLPSRTWIRMQTQCQSEITRRCSKKVLLGGAKTDHHDVHCPVLGMGAQMWANVGRSEQRFRTVFEFRGTK